MNDNRMKIPEIEIECIIKRDGVIVDHETAITNEVDNGNITH